MTVAATDCDRDEAGPTAGQFTVTRTGATSAALTVAYTVAGTATAGSDYAALPGSVVIPAGSATATIAVSPVNDTAIEVDETVVATISASAAYTVGAPASATVTIQSDDVALPTVTIAATDPTATEAGTTTGLFTVTRTGATAAALTVAYAVGGTATAGSDYAALSGSVVIPAGSSTATVTVTPINDTAVEADETVVAALSASAAYTVGGAGERDRDDSERRCGSADRDDRGDGSDRDGGRNDDGAVHADAHRGHDRGADGELHRRRERRRRGATTRLSPGAW